MPHASRRLRRGCLSSKLVASKSWSRMPEDESDPARLELTFDEARRMQPLLKGKPVCLNHIKDLVVGRVLDSSITPSGEWQVEFELDDDSALVASAIDSRHFYGLSLAHDYESFEPEEVSLCREGAREHARVFVPTSTTLNASNGLPLAKKRTVLCASLDASRLFSLQASQPSTADSMSAPAAASSMPTPAAQPAPQQQQHNGPQDDADMAPSQQQPEAGEALSEHVTDELAKRQTFESVAKLMALKGLSVGDKERIKAHMTVMAEQISKSQKEIAEHRDSLAKREAELKQREEELQQERQGRQLDQRTHMEVFKRLPGLNLDPQEELDLERDLAPVYAKSQPMRKVIECCRKIGDKAAFLKEYNIQDGISPDDLASAQKMMAMTSAFAPMQAQMQPRATMLNASSNKRNYAAMSAHSAPLQQAPTGSQAYDFGGALDSEVAALFASTPAASSDSSATYSRSSKRAVAGGRSEAI